MTKLWEPSAERVAQANLTAFLNHVGERWGAAAEDYNSLWRWSVEEPEKFWLSVWDFCGLIASHRGETVVEDFDKMPGARWFPEARLNFAENLLKAPDDRDAIVFWGEDKVKRRLTRAELYALVSRLAQAFRAQGVVAGDRVAGFMPNMPETVAAMLAAASIGAIWSSASPDFGVQGVLDRFGQIEPKILISADGYFYGGKAHDSLQRLDGIMAGLPSVQALVVVPYTRAAPDVSGLPKASLLEDFIAPYQAGTIDFAQLSFDHPLYIMFSSGTTGVPKCILHSAGGVLIQHLKEHQLHADLKPGDRAFYFTTCGWMMWNWLVSALASECVLMLYDGSPGHLGSNILWDYAQAEKITLFGTSAKWLDAIAKQGLAPMESHDLSSIRTITSTGSVLAPEGFDYVYGKVKKDVLLSSISGGTDIVSCFMLGNPIGPVWRGEIQARGLGMKVEVFDEDGRPVQGEKGELVCSAPFPCMPVGFWNDPDGAKYHAAYFDRFPNVWTHGDWVELTEHGGIIVYGRSDATLNPGGVRIGTAEIYRQVEKLDEVIESLVIGQDWDNDVRVVLFVRLRDGLILDEELTARIKKTIRENTTPRHVPAKIIQIQDIPRTKSGKIVELAVRNVVHGRPVKNKESLANPEALDLYEDIPELTR
ncbi:acetoacetate--CoA ligase [Telmatospirillum sp. J64-1]|uniref:acetoacetate--CoA ligase n=1 Tax=Telmatospirillum sp. J64-1 TaxID=2502183 RepID=UPI00115E6149|nr:acetoacetate--CoA ligase [Telmatospirillum sp. J64-1]